MDNMHNIVNKYAQVRALVIGDAMIDQYHFGSMDRLSPEAPIGVYVEDYDRAETRRGGADNVAHQLEVLGAQVYTVFPHRRSCKHRYFVGHHQVFRRDSDSHDIPGKSAFDAVLSEMVGVNVVVLSDYAKGWLTPALCQSVMHKGAPVVVDPKVSDWSRYQGADVVCPNQREYDLADRDTWEPEHMVIKRGALGLRITTSPKLVFHDIPTTAKQVYDVTGAGDTITALIAAGIALGSSLEEAATVANHAAGVVCGKLGTAVCTLDELRASLCA